MSSAAKAPAVKGKAAVEGESIQLYTVNGGKKSALIPLKRYSAMHKAITRALKKRPDGLSLLELTSAAAQYLPAWWSKEGWDEVWHTTTVKLHMEHLGELERVPKVSPQRVRLTGSADTPAGARQAAALAAKQERPPTMKRPKSPGEMHDALQRNLPLKTGRSMAEWIAIVKAAGHSDWQSAEKWLKSEHGLSTMYAHMVAYTSFNKPFGVDYSDEEGLLSAMYANERAALREVHDKVKKLALSFGPDAEMVVCKTYASFRAKSQFAVVKPTTREAVDIGLALPPDTPYSDRLLEAKNLGGGERNRHRIRVSSAKEVDREVEKWLKAAYEWDLKRNQR